MNKYAINQEGALFISLNTLLGEKMVSAMLLTCLVILVFFILFLNLSFQAKEGKEIKISFPSLFTTAGSYY